MICNLCPRKCNAERTATENIGGFCREPLKPHIARAALHFWEEPVISGKRGSGTVFFSGCNLGCVYCQNFKISKENYGKAVSEERLAEIFKNLEDMGAENINLVTPTHFTEAIISALKIYRPKIPIVYNSSGYETTEQIEMLNGFIDIYLMDLKYLDPFRAEKYSFASDYPDYAKKAIIKAYNQVGGSVVENGIMKRGLIVRHLLLPQGTSEAIKIFDFVKDNCRDAYFSLMAQYIPLSKAKEDKVIGRKITRREYEKVTDYIINSGFDNVFIQELSSADKEYIPPFDLEGI